jgi:hypothetical protein
VLEWLLIPGIIGLFLLLFFAASVTGPDFDHYLRWARAFGSGDTIAFWDKGHISPRWACPSHSGRTAQG